MRLEEKQAMVIADLVAEWAGRGADFTDPDVCEAFRDSAMGELERIKERMESVRDPEPVKHLDDAINDIQKMKFRILKSDGKTHRCFALAITKAEEAILWYENGRGAIRLTQGTP